MERGLLPPSSLGVRGNLKSSPLVGLTTLLLLKQSSCLLGSLSQLWNLASPLSHGMKLQPHNKQIYEHNCTGRCLLWALNAGTLQVSREPCRVSPPLPTPDSGSSRNLIFILKAEMPVNFSSLLSVSYASASAGFNAQVCLHTPRQTKGPSRLL